MNDYHRKLGMIQDLYAMPKEITFKGQEHLRDKTVEYMQATGKNLLDAEVFEFIVTYTYNEAYRAAIADVLKVIQSP